MGARAIITVFVLTCLANSLLVSADESRVDNFSINTVCLRLLQQQINAEMHASLVYMNMAAHFNNPNVARFGFGKFYQYSSTEEREHAQKIIDYINLRGGEIGPINVEASPRSSYKNVIDSLRFALDYENKINNMLHLLHGKADEECRDAHLMDFIESEYFDEQIRSINELKSLITTLSKMDSPIGEYLMDQEMQKRFQVTKKE